MDEQLPTPPKKVSQKLKKPSFDNFKTLLSGTKIDRAKSG
jgi:hypothetical protein